MKNNVSIILQGITLLLTVAILVILLLPKNGTVDSISNNDYVKSTLENEKAMREYQIEIGKSNVTISNDKISKSSYSSYIIGDVTNVASKTIYGVSIHISFYKNGKFVDSASEYYTEIPSNTTVPLNVYAPDDFSTYSIDYTMAHFLD